jgi:hypothetical protein
VRAGPLRVRDEGLKQWCSHGLGWPGSDLLSQVLRHSTIGAKAVDGRVRDGIGSGHLAKATRPAKPMCAAPRGAVAALAVRLVLSRRIVVSLVRRQANQVSID